MTAPLVIAVPLKVPSKSPMAAITTRLTLLPVMTFSRVCAKFSKITTVSAPLSLSRCLSSWEVYSGLTLTTTAPMRKMANKHTGY